MMQKRERLGRMRINALRLASKKPSRLSLSIDNVSIKKLHQLLNGQQSEDGNSLRKISHIISNLVDLSLSSSEHRQLLHEQTGKILKKQMIGSGIEIDSFSSNSSMRLCSSHEICESSSDSSQNKEGEFLKEMLACKKNENSARHAKKVNPAKSKTEKELKKKFKDKIIECFVRSSE